MPNKLIKTTLITAFCLLATGTAISAPPSTDAQGQKLMALELKLASGDLRPVLAIAAKFGRSQGVFTGTVAEQVQKQFGNAVIKVKAVRMQDMERGCPKVVATIYNAQMPTQQQEIPFRVCPK